MNVLNGRLRRHIKSPKANGATLCGISASLFSHFPEDADCAACQNKYAAMPKPPRTKKLEPRQPIWRKT